MSKIELVYKRTVVKGSKVKVEEYSTELTKKFVEDFMDDRGWEDLDVNKVKAIWDGEFVDDDTNEIIEDLKDELVEIGKENVAITDDGVDYGEWEMKDQEWYAKEVDGNTIPVVHNISRKEIKNAQLVLATNGVELSEVGVVLQAIGYTLLNTELDDEVVITEKDVEELVGKED